MALFDKAVESIGVRPKNYLEPTFDYYNRTARKDIAKIKEVMEEWFTSYPQKGQDDLRSRFRSAIESQHQAAFFELFVYRVFWQLGYAIELHPDVGTATHPDFLVRNEIEQFLVEVTTTHDSEEDVAAQRRIDQVYDTLNRLKSPDFFIAIIDKGVPVSPVPGARLRVDLEKWLRGLSWNDVKDRWDRDGFDGVPSFVWKHDGWDVVFKVIPKSEANRGSLEIRPIGLTMPSHMEMLAAEEEVKRAVIRKDKYGETKLPLLLAINVLGDFCDTFDVMNALFGRETVVFSPDGIRPGGRLHDGAWDGPKGPQHRSISAVLVFHALNAWSINNTELWMIHNPWATQRLSSDTLPITQYVPNFGAGHLEQKSGKPVSEILKLPDPWPPDDT